MDAKQLGSFIADRRKELGMTQAELAKKLHVTDKAVSRWERGVGLPDINSMEALAEALQVGLVELMRAQRNPDETISTREAELLLGDTIALSRTNSLFTKLIGGVVLAGFAVVSVILLLILISDGSVVVFSVGSLLAGLIAWGIPIGMVAFSRSGNTGFASVSSFGFALFSVAIQFFDIANEVNAGDWAAIEDTIHVLALVVVLFCAVTVFLNTILVWRSLRKK